MDEPLNETTDKFTSMSDDEFSKLQEIIAKEKERRELGARYELCHTIDQVLENIALSEYYKNEFEKLKEVQNPVQAIMNNDNVLKFPMLMALACFAPCSEEGLRCALIQIFDSYKYHSGLGDVVSQFVPFKVDQALTRCRMKTASSAYDFMDDFYRQLISIMNSPCSSDKEAKDWIKHILDQIVFINDVIMKRKGKIRFYAALHFLSGRIIDTESLSDPKEHKKLVEEFFDNGMDFAYANAILPIFE